MKRIRYSPQQIIRKLREAARADLDAAIAEARRVDFPTNGERGVKGYAAFP
jgi:hypothetical protein